MTLKKASGQKGNVIYFSHGGGPLPILGEKSHKAMVEFLEHLPASIEKPDAIIVISAHWEEETATVLGASDPVLFYDYYGFAEEAYQITYPAPGHPELAARIRAILKNNAIDCHIDNERGYDHGLFIPLKLMYPKADIPSIQISLIKGLDPALHMDMGNTLNELLNEKILIIGSGFSFHNMRAFVWDGNNPADHPNDSFQDWLIETCTAPLPYEERKRRLIEWENAPASRYCHPREEHLLPLHLCAGIAADAGPATKIFDDYILGKRAVAFLW